MRRLGYRPIVVGSALLFTLFGGHSAKAGPPPYLINDKPSATETAIVGDYAYVANGGAGLEIQNISKPEKPVIVGSVSTGSITNVSGISVSGSYAYLAAWNSLQVADISNPASPTIVKKYTANNALFYGAVAQGGYLYAVGCFVDPSADPNAYPNKVNQVGMTVFDLSNPTDPQRVATYTSSDGTCGQSININDFKIINSTAYLLSYAKGLEIVSISDPLHPVLLGSINKTSSQDYFAPISLDINGRYAYLSDQSKGLRIIDVGNPSLPSQVGIYTGSGGTGFGIKALDSVVYVTQQRRVLSVNISNPSLPTLLKAYTIPDAAQALDVLDKYFIISDGASGLQLLSISGENAEPPATFNPKPIGLYRVGQTSGVAVDGSRAYLAAGSVFQVVDISDPMQPSLLGSYMFPSYSTAGSAYKVSVQGKYAYIAAGWGGLQIFDVSNPTKPTLLGKTSGGYSVSVMGLAVVGHFAYVTIDNGIATGKLEVINIADPAHPSVVGSFPFGTRVLTLAAAGTAVYVFDETSGNMMTIDVADPTTPALVNTALIGTPINITEGPMGAVIDGATMFVADSHGGLRVVDLTDPRKPVLIGTYAASGQSVSVVENKAFLIQLDGQLLILDISNPKTPKLLGQSKVSDQTWQVQSANGLVYAATLSGLRIIDPNPFVISSSEANQTIKPVGSTFISPFGDGYKGAYAVKKVSLRDPALTVYIYIPTQRVKGPVLAILDKNENPLQSAKPFDDQYVSGLTATAVTLKSGQSFLAVGTKGSGRQVAVYRITRKGLVKISNLRLAANPGKNLNIKFLQLRTGQVVLATMIGSNVNTVTFWTYSTSKNIFLKNTTISRAKVRIIGETITVR